MASQPFPTAASTATGTHPVTAAPFRDPNEIAVRLASIRLLREILDYQRRLNHLLGRADPQQAYLVDACRRAIRVRRQLLRDLPQPVDRDVPDPWREAPAHAAPA